MKKIMLVTVGTSLFESASWKFDEDGILEQIPLYAQWNDKGKAADPEPGPLLSPEKRRLTGKRIIDQLKTSITMENAEEFSGFFENKPSKEELLRYSAELSTMFELAYEYGDNICEGLGLFKDNIWLIADPNPVKGMPNPQYIAALHIKAYLEKTIPGLGVEIMEIPGLSSTARRILLDKDGQTGLLKLGNEVKEKLKEATELVVAASAGYKIYAVLFGALLWSDKLTIAYRHENSNLLLYVTKNKIRAEPLDDLADEKSSEVAIPFIDEWGGLE